MAKSKAIISSRTNPMGRQPAMPAFDFEGTNCIVTGATTGIGKEIALTLAARGANVSVLGRSRAGLERTKRYAKNKRRFHIYVTDLRNSDSIESVVADIQRQHGPVDILMNVAGVWHDENRAYVDKRLWQIASGEIDEVLGVGFLGSLRLTRAVLKSMVRKQSGKVVFISCAFDGAYEAVGWLHYYAANQAIEAVCKGLAMEVGAYGIQVNCVAPSFVATPAVKRFFPKEARRALAPSQVADAALFLATAAAENITGQIVQLRSKPEIDRRCRDRF